ncbi:DTW domain-containing protein [Verrucomicrobiales bacterium]|nr:DTW domain-containing protein [Verrucomicrobiales bacterium]
MAVLTLTDYLEKKHRAGSSHRETCYVCHRAASVCLCEMIRPFYSRTRFIILMHPKEANKEGSGTGRLCHLALQNSSLLIGDDFSDDQRVNDLIADPDFRSVLLFPSPGAIDLSHEGYQALGHSPANPLQIFVVDGTWRLAGKILRLSENLRALPAVKFSPRHASKFRVKKQPREECLSTLESIHFLLELGLEQGFETLDGEIGQLPDIFDQLVAFQMQSAAVSTRARA